MKTINKLANTIEKSIILHFDDSENLTNLTDFEFDRPAMTFNFSSENVSFHRTFSFLYFSKIRSKYYENTVQYIIFKPEFW